jgi:hypothetical protein
MCNCLYPSRVIGQGLGILWMLGRREALGSSTKIESQTFFMCRRTDKDILRDTTLHYDYCEFLWSELQLNIVKCKR